MISFVATMSSRKYKNKIRNEICEMRKSMNLGCRKCEYAEACLSGTDNSRLKFSEFQRKIMEDGRLKTSEVYALLHGDVSQKQIQNYRYTHKIKYIGKDE